MTFFALNNNRFDDYEFAYGEQFEGFKTGDAVRCEECGSYLTMLKWLPPHDIKVSKKVLGDFIFGTYPGFIVSLKFKLLFEKEKLKGILRFYPVRIYHKGKVLDVNYYYPEIVLSNAKVDLVSSGFKFDGNEICNTCQKAGRVIIDMKGLFFEDGSTISEDVFNTKVIGGPFVSERIKNLITENNLSNLFLVEASKYKPSWILK